MMYLLSYIIWFIYCIQLNNCPLQILLTFQGSDVFWSPQQVPHEGSETCLSLPSLRSSTSPALWSWPWHDHLNTTCPIPTGHSHPVSCQSQNWPQRSTSLQYSSSWRPVQLPHLQWEHPTAWRDMMTYDGSDGRYRKYRKWSNNVK